MGTKYENQLKMFADIAKTVEKLELLLKKVERVEQVTLALAKKAKIKLPPTVEQSSEGGDERKEE